MFKFLSFIIYLNFSRSVLNIKYLEIVDPFHARRKIISYLFFKTYEQFILIGLITAKVQDLVFSLLLSIGRFTIIMVDHIFTGSIF